MDQIIIEGVRCFSNRLSAPLKPITLLIGENSTGKTTFLALSRIAWDICQGPLLVDFNEEPFLLGAYHQIASYRGGRSGRAKYFMIGAEMSISSHIKKNLPFSLEGPVTITSCFSSEEGQPRLKEWTLSVNSFRVELKMGGGKEVPLATITTPSTTVKVSEKHFEEIFGRGSSVTT
jgi:hypothetical protein